MTINLLKKCRFVEWNWVIRDWVIRNLIIEINTSNLINNRFIKEVNITSLIPNYPIPNP